MCKSKKRCEKCKGCGFIKYTPITCKTCNGIKCIMCNSSGLEKMPWDLCDICYGDGTIIVRTNS